jgi:hypothetical protein
VDSKQSRTRNMYQVVINILQAFVAVWTSYTPFSDAVTLFQSDVSEIDDVKEKQQQILSGYAINKKQKKKDMATIASIISKKVRGFAADSGDSILYNQMKISFTRLFRTRDTDSVGFAELIHTAANAMTPEQRTAYKISAADLTLLRNSIDTFKTLPSPADVKAIRKQLTESLPGMFNKTTGVLKNTIDNLISDYMVSHPDFYGQYFNARRTFESHRHTTVEGTTIDAATGEDLSNVQVSITSSSGNFQELTDVQGSFKQQIEPEVTYTAKFILPGYETVEYDNIKLSRGVHEKFDVKLNKVNP